MSDIVTLEILFFVFPAVKIVSYIRAVVIFTYRLWVICICVHRNFFNCKSRKNYAINNLKTMQAGGLNLYLTDEVSAWRFINSNAFFTVESNWLFASK